MNIILTPEQERWLNARVADGEFASLEAAVRQLIVERMALEDDFAWARPYVVHARAAVARREFVSPDQAMANIDAVIESLKAQGRNPDRPG
jgi:antitoxin ParD1/3/4